MNILWITNITFPEAEMLLCGSNKNNTGAGGWMLSLAQSLSKSEDISLSVASISPLVTELTVIKGGKIIYYILPLLRYGKTNKKYEIIWRAVKGKSCPDVIHIHGTEYPYGLSYINSCGAKNVVISIQGLVSVIARYYLGGMTTKDIIYSITLRDIFKGTLFHSKRNFSRMGLLELEYIRKVDNIIGRTSWDKAHVLAINPNCTYHFCNEILRNSFHNNIWEYEKCVKHSIFISQATYPLKGLHQVIKAMHYILPRYPDTVIYIAGDNITKHDTIEDKLRISGYGSFLRKLIRQHNIEEHIKFLGALNEEQMCSQYLSANVFICPSIIENSPNSLGEAQLLGVPCIAAYVGGIPDMIPNENCGILYRFEEIEQLAMAVCKVFSISNTFDNKQMRDVAFIRHNVVTNTNRTIEIYKRLLQV